MLQLFQNLVLLSFQSLIRASSTRNFPFVDNYYHIAWVAGWVSSILQDLICKLTEFISGGQIAIVSVFDHSLLHLLGLYLLYVQNIHTYLPHFKSRKQKDRGVFFLYPLHTRLRELFSSHYSAGRLTDFLNFPPSVNGVTASLYMCCAVLTVTYHTQSMIWAFYVFIYPVRMYQI